MPNDDLPLPDPKGVLHDAFGNDPLTFVPWPPPQSLYVSCLTLAIYTADQMRAYGDARAAAATERAAQVCDEHASIEGIAQACAAATGPLAASICALTWTA